MMVDTDALVTASAIAKRFGVVQSTVTNWQDRTALHFPAPVFQDSRVKLWVWADVLAWYEARNQPTIDTRDTTRLDLAAATYHNDPTDDTRKELLAAGQEYDRRQRRTYDQTTI